MISKRSRGADQPQLPLSPKPDEELSARELSRLIRDLQQEIEPIQRRLATLSKLYRAKHGADASRRVRVDRMVNRDERIRAEAGRQIEAGNDVATAELALKFRVSRRTVQRALRGLA